MQDSAIAFPARFPTLLPICISCSCASAVCSQSPSGGVPWHRCCFASVSGIAWCCTEMDLKGSRWVFLGLGGAAPCRQVVGGSPPGAGRWALVLTGLVCSAHTAMSAVYKFCLGCFFFFHLQILALTLNGACRGVNKCWLIAH